MSFFLALDAGGTKTDYLLADETRELARVRTGTIKRMRVDAATASQNLESALTQLSAQTGVSMASITRTCIGTAGESVPLVRDWLQSSFSARVGGGLLILGDVEIALEAAFPGRAGVLALAGTGSNVLGRTSGGQLITAGGWGPALADQGSGHRIGLESLRATFLAKDEERQTLLLSAVMDFWQLSSLDSLVEYANSRPAPDYSKLTEVVVRCAELGDETALGVLAAARRRACLPGTPGDSPAAPGLERARVDTAHRVYRQHTGKCHPGTRCSDRSGAARISQRSSSG